MGYGRTGFPVGARFSLLGISVDALSKIFILCYRRENNMISLLLRFRYN
jgi:hypothetical protein